MSPAKVPGCATPEDGCCGEAADVRFVDDAVHQRNVERLIVSPSKSFSTTTLLR